VGRVAGVALVSERRLDWTVLLPANLDPPVETALVFGGDGEVGEDLVASGLAAEWRRALHPADTAPLVVACADADTDLADLARHTAPGGALVIQLGPRRQRPSGLRALRLRRSLNRAGLQVVSLHHVSPSFRSSRRFVPVDRPGPLGWHVRHLVSLPPPAGSLVRVAGGVAGTRLGPPIVAAISPRLLVIAVKPVFGMPIEALEPPPPLAALDGEPADRVIVLTSGYDRASRTVALVFPGAPGRDRVPRTVVKIASGPDTGEGTFREMERLRDLHANLDPDLARSLPEPRGCTVVLDRLACEQSCASGPSLASVTRVHRHRGRWPDLEHVASWLDRFGQATRRVAADAAGQPLPAAWTEVFTTLADDLEVPQAVVELNRAMADVARTTGLAVIAVHQHYDTGPWNVHLVAGRPVLVDWETDVLRPEDSLGPPLADVLYLVTYWYFMAAGIRDAADEPAALVRLFADAVPAGPLEDAARRVVDRSLQAAGLPRQAVPAALVALWAERARYTDGRRRAHGRPLQAVDNVPLRYLNALAAVAPVAFGPHGWWQYPLGSRVIVQPNEASTSRPPASLGTP
jgi:hypothetical protein